MQPAGPEEAELEALASLFARGPVAVLTGAGISTESGIPDYRGPETRRRARNPVQFAEFVKSESARRRYWARSMIGWPRFSRAAPNAGHRALAALERLGYLAGVVTQNVDGLHGQAGSVEPVELHGALRRVVCLVCGERSSREALQLRLEHENPSFVAARAELAPDGDADLTDERVASFRVVDCPCGGPLKPDVVFFGEQVPRTRVGVAMERVARGAVLLVIGSSLAVYSGLRFVRAAHERGAPIAIITYGETRADSLAMLRIDASAGETLRALLARLGGC